jgi:Spy/CpxP family protein refolding chaperone
MEEVAAGGAEASQRLIPSISSQFISTSLTKGDVQMKKCIYSAIAFAIATSCFAFAQDSGAPRTPPSPEQMVAHQVARLTTLLSLTSAQQAQATAIYTAEQTAATSLRTNMRTAHSALQTATENNDVAGITAQATEIGSLTAQQIESRAKAEAAFYAMLTADQQAKYKQLKPGPGGPGGFGHRGPGGRGPDHL